ncbi:type II toxin-antitoxin system HicA family toxin [Sinimarinibacterium flocculans]|uniref:type II toxin-antitoxin system HicA family toxin n=1 Tax=Sinimarinibacterium flocculans TaxID=985250 RepID=UPI00351821E7
MSQRLPAANAQQIIRALERAGFEVVRISGSHHLLIHRSDATRRVTVPYHGSTDLPRGLLRAIIRQAGLSVAQFSDLL